MLNILDTDDSVATLSRSQGIVYQLMYDTYPTIRICRDLIRQYVFERPLIAPDSLDQSVYRRLGSDIFDQAMVLGIAIVRAKPGSNRV